MRALMTASSTQVRIGVWSLRNFWQWCQTSARRIGLQQVRGDSGTALSQSRGLASHGACLPAASSHTGVTALLLRLVGLARQQLSDSLAWVALEVAGRLCCFDTAHRAERLVAVAAMVAGCTGPMRAEVREVFCRPMVRSETRYSAINLALTLVEAAAQHSKPAPDGDARHTLLITGTCSWLPLDSWVLACAVKLLQADDPAPDAGNLQRQVVVAAVRR